MSEAAYPQIVVGTDGSSTAQRAVGRAIAIARATGASLSIATSWYRDMPDGPVPSELAEYPGGSTGGHEASWAETTVSDAAGVARSSGLDDPRTSTPQGAPADALIELVAEQRDALLVVGTYGLGSRAERFLGNVPHQITHHAPVDVLLVRTGDPDDLGPYSTVALATDGSDTAARAVARGLAFADSVGGKATLLTAASSQEAGERAIDKAREQLPDDADIADEVVVVGRHAGETLVDAARGYDLLVVGNKGMSGPSRLLGSVANEVTHRVPTDLLLVNTTRR